MCNGWQKQALWFSGIQTKRRMCQTCNKVNGWQLWVARRSVKEYNGKNLEDGKGSGGNGRLKNARNDPMQNFYGSSIHDNKADVPKMSAEVMGKARSLQNYHPKGPKSCCNYQHHEVLGTSTYVPLKYLLTEAVVKTGTPIFDCLGNLGFEGCINTSSQNANEPSNKVLWSLFLKEV